MEQIHDRVAGLDVHRDQVTVCVRTPGPRGGVQTEKARFGTTTGGLAALAEWLAGHAVTLAAMEATGVYWKPVYYALEGRFAVWLCNAHHVKNVPGRKTDMSDAEWLADVAAHGMVRPSFVPPPPIRELRELTRYRKTQIDVRAAEIARLEKVLQDAGIKLTSVASKVLTQSGRAMVESLIAGERDPAALAGLAKGKLRPKIPQLTEALRGHFGAHHAIVAARILAHLDFLDDDDRGTRRARSPPGSPGATSQAARLLAEVPGLERRSVEVIIAETGADMSCFPSPAHLASWAGPVPGQSRVGRQAPQGGHHARQPVAAAHHDRVGQGGGADQGQLLRRPVPADSPAPGPEQGRGRGRPQPARRDLAHAHHRRGIRRPRRGLLHLPPRQGAPDPAPRQASWRNSATPWSSPPPHNRHRPAPSARASPWHAAARPMHGCISPQIEHRLFSRITMNWRGRPLASHEIIVNSIAAATTATGLRVHAELDTGAYPAGIKVSDAQMDALPLVTHYWHGEWNYTLIPAPPAAAAPAPQPPAAPPPDLAWLAHPAITGMTRPALDALTAALAAPAAALREAALDRRRGHRPRQQPGGRRPRLTLTAKLLAAILHDRHHLPQRAIAALLGVRHELISRYTSDIRRLLRQAGHTIEPAPATLATLDDLYRHATAAGITIPGKIKTAR